MSEAKAMHTPGPWAIDETKTFGTYGVWTDCATQPGHASQICSMLTVSFKQTDKATRPTRDANARLIAAAPELLAWCEDYRLLLRALIDTQKTAAPDLAKSNLSTLDLLEVVINKAIGAQS